MPVAVGSLRRGARAGELLRRHHAELIGSKVRIARFVVIEKPSSSNHGEVTEKGYLNPRVLLERRCDAIARLFGSEECCDGP